MTDIMILLRIKWGAVIHNNSNNLSDFCIEIMKAIDSCTDEITKKDLEKLFDEVSSENHRVIELSKKIDSKTTLRMIK